MANLDESIFQYKGTYAAQSNCFTCHATVVDGQVVSGAMSTQIDQLSGYVRLAGLMQIEPILQGAIQQAIANGVPGAEADAEVFDSFTTHLADILLPIFQNSTARGTNLGPFTVWKTLARTIGPGLTAADRASGTALDYLFENTPFPTVDANPWWIYKYKDSIYRYADQSEHAGHFAFTFSQPRPDANIERPEQIEIMKNVLTYINQLESPAYKERISLYKAYYGKLLFHGDAKLHNGETLPCSQCHGTYTKKSNWLKVGGYEVDYNESGLRNVGTDGAYSEFLRSTGAEIVTERLSQIQDFFVDPALKPDIQVPSTLGYLPPILDGVWASAPYFHNGSVPTLYQVLNSKARAKIWKRSINPFAYNHNQVGLRHKSLTDEEYLGLALAAQGQHPFSPAALEFRQAYNTTDYGKGNGGHTAGDVMNHWERMAVIEFLKTLSGSNMEPSQ